MTDTETTTTATSEADPNATGVASTGAADDGGAGGSGGAGQPASTVSAEELERRALQSERDRLRAEVAQLRASGQPAPGSQGDDGEGLIGTDELGGVIEGVLTRREAVNAWVAKTKTDYPNARPEIFANAGNFNTAAEFVYAAQQSHQAETAYRDQVRKEIDQQVRAEYEGKPGAQPGSGTTTPATATPASANGELSQEQVLGLPPEEFDAWATANPEAHKRMLGLAV